MILAVLKRRVSETKRIDFFANATANEGVHQEFLETAVENTLVAIATGSVGQ